MRHRNRQEIIADYFLKLENLAAKMMKEIIDIYEPNQNFGSETSYFKRGNFKTTHSGIQLQRYLGSNIRHIVPLSIKTSKPLNKFKTVNNGSLKSVTVNFVKLLLLYCLYYTGLIQSIIHLGRVQSPAKYVENLLVFTENLDLNRKFDVASWLFSTK